DVAVVRGLIVGARSDSALPGMIGNDDRCLPDVVLVIRLGELVAHPGMQRIRIAARFALGGNESGIHRDANDVRPRRHRSLAVAASISSYLAGELPHVDVRPPMADAL